MDMESPYDFDYTPTYTNDEEYQRDIQILFRMDTTSGDFSEYEEEPVNLALNYLYEKTKEIAILQELYDLGAAKMMSEDREIGMTILFSYDYMLVFHALLKTLFIEMDQIRMQTLFEKLKDILRGEYK